MYKEAGLMNCKVLLETVRNVSDSSQAVRLGPCLEAPGDAIGVLSTELCSLVKLKILSDGIYLSMFVLQLRH
jgi:hypothetical protein